MTRRAPPWSWWARCVVHNIIVHPWLPLADALDSLGYRRLPQLIYWAHDRTAEGLEGGGMILSQLDLAELREAAEKMIRPGIYEAAAAHDWNRPDGAPKTVLELLDRLERAERKLSLYRERVLHQTDYRDEMLELLDMEAP